MDFRRLIALFKDNKCSVIKLLRVSDGSGALFLRGVSASQKKAGTYSTTRSCEEERRSNL